MRLARLLSTFALVTSVACGSGSPDEDGESPSSANNVALRSALEAKWVGTWQGTFVTEDAAISIPFELTIEAREKTDGLSPACGTVSLNGVRPACITVKELAVNATLTSEGNEELSIPAFDRTLVTAKVRSLGGTSESQLEVATQGSISFLIFPNGSGSWQDAAHRGTVAFQPPASK